ncbi:thiol reductant ABC exporter subunit CydC [uncultured Roseibium sp.]|uniref:thiol reductant ABC exporter subunit CydC n=1 Tax=uncultured Roseibium sp. TaxID=1936171 RepID=UPI0026112723|nr:thiol reductant ABC exporter subunit CydC [uncultured Roseibium sp.]
MKTVWQIILEQYRYSRFHFGIGILVALLPTLAGALLLGVSGWFITAAAIAGTTGAFLNIFVPSAIIRALAIIRTAGRYGERVLTHDATFRFLTGLRDRVFSAIAHSNERGQRSGLVLNRLTLDIAALDTVYLRLVVPLLVAAILALLLALIWWTLSFQLFLVGSVFLSSWAVLAWISFAKADRKNARREDAASDAIGLRAADLIAGRRDLAIYGGLNEAARGVSIADDRQAKAHEALEERSTWLTAASTLIGQLFLAAVLMAAVLGAASGGFGIATAVGLVLVVMALPEIFSMMLPGLAGLPRIALAARRTVNRVRAGNAVQSVDQVQEIDAALEVGTDAIAFEKVSFRYPGATGNVIDDVSFQIRPGEVVALSGRSGCGKSTVAALASRLVTPDRGRICLAGRSLDSLPEETLRQSVTVLSQRAYLFNDTVAANLRIAAPLASDGELWAALEKAALGERMSRNAEGLQAILGEGGVGLSGGEQRRLALARAFLTRPDLFILDEMTEGLDEGTSKEVLDRFNSHRGSAAVLIVAHKKCELDLADRIVNLRALQAASGEEVR